MKRKRCKIEDCNGYHHAKGLCRSHYMKQWNRNQRHYGKRDTIGRVFEVIDLMGLELRKVRDVPITTTMIKDRLNVSYGSATYWIMQLSRYLPIIETGRVHGTGQGSSCKRYEVMED